MKKYLQNFPIEVYILLLPALLFFISTFAFYVRCAHKEIGTVCRAHFLDGHLLSVVANNDMFAYAVIPLTLYAVFAVLWSFFRHKTDSTAFRTLCVRLRSFVFVFGTVFLFALSMSFSAQLMFNTADKGHIAQISNTLMNTDKILFGVYPPLWLNGVINSTLLSKVILRSYFTLFSLVFGLIAMTVFRSKELFRKFILAYFFAFMVGVPLWLFFPAIAPDSIYRANILHLEVPNGVQQVFEQTKFLPTMNDTFDRMEKYWVDTEGVSIAITTFPSMHAAWGVIVAVIAIELFPPLFLAVVPWFVLELIGAVYTMQHYAVDIIVGVVIGFLSLWVAKKLLTFEKRYFKDKYSLFAIPDFFIGNYNRFLSRIKKYNPF